MITLVILFGFAVTPTYAGTFSDNFDDGNADGWWLGYSQHTPWVNGNWRIETGELVNDQPGDQFNALVQDIQVASQTAEVSLKTNGPSGYGGIALWYQDDNNWLNILIYPAAQEIWVIEHIDGVNNLSRYPFSPVSDNTWYKLKIEANSSNGELKIYVDDNYILTHQTLTTHRIGKSGVNNGNAGSFFDNFKVTADSIIDPLIGKIQCKNNGWKLFTNPTFKNQGGCISYLESN